MFGTRGKEDVTAAKDVLNDLAKLYEKETAKIPVDFFFEMKENQQLLLKGKSQEMVGSDLSLHRHIYVPYHQYCNGCTDDRNFPDCVLEGLYSERTVSGICENGRSHLGIERLVPGRFPNLLFRSGFEY